MNSKGLTSWLQIFVVLWMSAYLIFYHRVLKRILRRSLQSHETFPPPSGEKVSQWSRLEIPQKPEGLSCNPISPLVIDKNCKVLGLTVPCSHFEARKPEKNGMEPSKIALVMQFEEDYISAIASTLQENWYHFPPCKAGSKKLDIDLVFYNEKKMSTSIKNYVLRLYNDLGKDKVGCFANDEPKFLSPVGVQSTWSESERSAFSFYSLFPLLEKDYKSFMHYKPGLKAVKPNFLERIVRQAENISCEPGGYWQVGYDLIYTDVKARKLGGNNLHQFGVNSMYVLGCPDFEDYKCRVQTYYSSKDKSQPVAGYRTEYEIGYERAMDIYRMQVDNYLYSRLVVQRFLYSSLVIDSQGIHKNIPPIIKDSPVTYFVDHGTPPKGSYIMNTFFETG